MSGDNNMLLKIRVFNQDSNQEYIHNAVPLDHVEMLRLNPSLKVEVIGRVKDKGRNRSSGTDA
jgi:hypothetical protein